MNVSWKSTILGIAFLAFVFGVLWLGLDHSGNFSTIWAALGPVVGVVTGVIPSYFFKQQADTANANAAKQIHRTVAYAESVPENRLGEVQQRLDQRQLT